MATTTAQERTFVHEQVGSPDGGDLDVAHSEWRDPRDMLVLLALTVAPIAFVIDMFFSVIVALPNRLARSIKQHRPRHGQAAHPLHGCH